MRRRLIEDLQIRNYSPRTIEAYVAAVVKLSRHTGRSPDQLGPEDLPGVSAEPVAGPNTS